MSRTERLMEVARARARDDDRFDRTTPSDNLARLTAEHLSGLLERHDLERPAYDPNIEPMDPVPVEVVGAPEQTVAVSGLARAWGWVKSHLLLDA